MFLLKASWIIFGKLIWESRECSILFRGISIMRWLGIDLLVCKWINLNVLHIKIGILNLHREDIRIGILNFRTYFTVWNLLHGIIFELSLEISPEFEFLFFFKFFLELGCWERQSGHNSAWMGLTKIWEACWNSIERSCRLNNGDLLLFVEL